MIVRGAFPAKTERGKKIARVVQKVCLWSGIVIMWACLGYGAVELFQYLAGVPVNSTFFRREDLAWTPVWGLPACAVGVVIYFAFEQS